MTDVRALRRDFARGLVSIGAIRTTEWRVAFECVERHRFVPQFYQWSEDGELPRPAAIDDDPDRWLPYVYSDRVIVVNPDGDRRCSSSQPSMMAAFLNALEVRDGNTVLEVGTGTGYHAALLCERLGADQVTTIDVDAEYVSTARARLAECGYRPAMAVADGFGGYAHRAPYDRIVATAAVARIPECWVDQLAPGGVLVAPLRGGRFSYGLVALRKELDGTLEGRLRPQPARFMDMRGGPAPASPTREDMAAILDLAHDGRSRHGAMPWWIVTSRPGAFGADFLLRVQVPDLAWFSRGGPADTWGDWAPGATTGLTGWRDGSWAVVETQDGREVVREGGPRELMRLVEESADLWSRLGEPSHTRYGITVARDGQQHLWLDCPQSPLRWGMT